MAPEDLPVDALAFVLMMTTILSLVAVSVIAAVVMGSAIDGLNPLANP